MPSKNVKITLPLNTKKEGWICVEAEIVDVAPHIAIATFAMHKSLDPQLGEYCVSNIETGLRICCDTKRNVCVKARKLLRTKTNARIAVAFKRAKKSSILKL